ncbi:hypothetical protein DPMN_108213 [Dreissena polymorpha]|uniref:Uncharacterized protein n=1 Tax=Dreissena polymorpha TaxID=45954 RepID=A0A9D4K8F7_DREPO|nr:hypothetical protein DPMN_108213 [Dreissena polymorpha]
MNLLTKFHEDRTIHVASRVHIGKNAPPLDSHFHEDRKINVASRVLTMKNSPPPGGHVFQPTGIIFKIVQDIIGMNLLTKFHEDLTINVVSRVKDAPPPGGHVFQTTGITNVDGARRTTHDGQKAITKAHHEHVMVR